MRIIQHGMTFDIHPQDHAVDKSFNVLVVEGDLESMIVFRDSVETLTGHEVELFDGGALASRDDVAQWLAFEVREYL